MSGGQSSNLCPKACQGGAQGLCQHSQVFVSSQKMFFSQTMNYQGIIECPYLYEANALHTVPFILYTACDKGNTEIRHENPK